MDLILPEPDIEITANKVALSSAISNLVHNAVQACGVNGQITIKRTTLKALSRSRQNFCARQWSRNERQRNSADF